MNQCIYMNNAATSWPKPDCVAEAVSLALQSPPGSMHRGGIDDFDVFDAVRQHLAPMLGVTDPAQIALGSNATWGLNLAIFGIALQAGDTVVTTKAEHNSVLRPLHRLEQQGIQVIYLDTDRTGRMDPNIWSDAMRRYQPKLSIFTHASNVTGAVQDAAALCAIARSAGSAVLVDLSQSLGCVPVELERWGADLAAFTGHKYLLGPQGTGGLWVRPGITLKPYLVGGTGIKSDLQEMPQEMPIHLEAGTGNEPSYHGLLAALRWRQNHSCSWQKPSARLRQGLVEAGASVIIPRGDCTPVVSFSIPGETAADVGYMLQESYDVICRTGLHCAPLLPTCLGVQETVRLSLSCFTTMEEVEAVISAVEDICG